MGEELNSSNSRGSDTHAFSTVIREVRDGLSSVAKSDFELAKVEVRETSGHLKAEGARLAVFGVFAALGVLPLFAFLAIGLGNILGHNYWLSSLILAIAFMGGGGLMAYASLKRLRAHDNSLPRTRRVIEQEISVAKRKVVQISERTKGRSA